MTLAVAVFSFTTVRASIFPVLVNFQMRIIDPSLDQDEPQRGPTIAPTVEIEDNTLTFVTPCDGLVLSLVNEENEVEFTTIISGATLILPSYLSGDYELQIISGNCIFYGLIEL